MNEVHAETPWDDDRWLDRLVDDELSVADRRQLLLSLDSQPDGWRRCALAFLEAQSWRRDLPGMLHEPVAEAPSTSFADRHSLSLCEHTEGVGAGLRRTQSSRVRETTNGVCPAWQRPAGIALAMAASFLIAFALGALWQRPPQPSASPEIVKAPVVSDCSENVLPTKPQEPQPASSSTQPTGDQVTLVVDGGAGNTAQSIDVPLVEAKGAPVDWQSTERSALEPMLERLEQMGHRVERQQRFAPVQLPDGRKFVVPVEDVEIVPVGRVVY